MKQERVQAAFGKALKRFRASLGVSQEQLAERAELHRTYVGDVERGERNISLLNIAKIADALRIKPSKLVREMEKHLEKTLR